MNEPLDLSIVIIAFNEEMNLPRCLKSLPSGAEVIVLDSGSTDQTASIARAFGAQVQQRPFTNFADHKNAALAFATRRWVLAMDADEEMDPSLGDAVLEVVNDGNFQAHAYRLQRRLVFMDRRMRFGKTRDWPVRLFLRSEGRYVGSIHEQLRVKGPVERLAGGIIWHYSYRDLSDYFVRFNRYTSAIAERHMAEGRQAHLVGHVLRPWLEFLSRYFLRLGFLDGYPGYTYALISSLYAFIKYAKIEEKRRRR